MTHTEIGDELALSDLNCFPDVGDLQELVCEVSRV